MVSKIIEFERVSLTFLSSDENPLIGRQRVKKQS